VVQVGSHATLVAEPGLYRRLYDLQVHGTQPVPSDF